jgi:hypothetical protein
MQKFRTQMENVDAGEGKMAPDWTLPFFFSSHPGVPGEPGGKFPALEAEGPDLPRIKKKFNQSQNACCIPVKIA